MVDYIVRNRIWDLGYYADWNITNLVRLKLMDGNDQIAADLKKQGSQATRGLKTLLNNYAKHQ